MIVWLNVPFAQKDKAKRLGARWSAGNKRWYVENATDLGPFMAWIDDRLKQPTKKKPEVTALPVVDLDKKAERRSRIRAAKKKQADENRERNEKTPRTALTVPGR